MKQFIVIAFRISLTWGLVLAISMFILWMMISPNPPVGETIDMVESLSEQIELFHLRTHQYPKRYEDLLEIFYENDERPSADKFKKYEGHYLLLPVLDPWGRKYRYQVPGIHQKNSFDLFSLGQDSQAETKDDINNWDKNYSRLEDAYRGSFIRRFFNDSSLFGILLFWLVAMLLTEWLSILLRKDSLSLWRRLISPASNTEEWMRLCSFLITGIFLYINSQWPVIFKQISMDINSIQIKTYRFKSKMGRYPHTDEEILKAFSPPDVSLRFGRREKTAEGSYLLIPVQDPWGKNYRYLFPGLHHPESFDLWSLGEDGKFETLDDIKSWDESWREYYGPGPLKQFLRDNPPVSLIMFWLSIAFLLKCLEWLLFCRRTEEVKTDKVD